MDKILSFLKENSYIKSMKVIFLDIDGVLNVISQGHDEYGSTFHPEFENNLRKIIDSTGAKIVISSSWRHSGILALQEMWDKRNLPGDIIDITPTVYDRIRGKEIDRWLKFTRLNIDNYVIIDDDDDMLENQLDNFVKTSGNSDHRDCIDIGYGLTDKCTEKAIHILNSKSNEDIINEIINLAQKENIKSRKKDADFINIPKEQIEKWAEEESVTFDEMIEILKNKLK